MNLAELREMIEYMEEEYGPECLEYSLVQAKRPGTPVGIDMTLISSFVMSPFIIVRLTEEIQ